MNVLHLVRSLNVGGLERVVLDLLHELRQRGIVSHIACLFEPGVLLDQASVDGTWIGKAGERGRWRTMVELAAYVRRHRIDIIHSHNPQPHLFAVGAGWLSGAAVVHTKHGRNYPDNPKAVWLNRQLARCSTHIAAVSRDAADVALHTEQIPLAKVGVIHNGVRVENYVRDTAAGLRYRREFGVPEDAFVIGSVGRLSSEKRYDLLVQAFATFAGKCGEHTASKAHQPVLVIIGDGADRGNVEASIAQAGIAGQVMLPGMSDRVADWLQTVDIFSLSSRTEGTSITLLEASACSIPSVLSDVGGNREIAKGGEGGFLLPYGDVDGMAGAFVKLAMSGELRRRMGVAACRSVTEDYSVSQMVQRYTAIYGEALVAGSPLRCLVRSLLPGSGIKRDGA